MYHCTVTVRDTNNSLKNLPVVGLSGRTFQCYFVSLYCIGTCYIAFYKSFVFVTSQVI